MKKLLIVLFLLFLQMAPSLVKAEEEIIQKNYDEELLKQGIQFLPPMGSQKNKTQANKELGIDAYYFLVPNKFFILVQSPAQISSESFEESVDGFRKDSNSEETINFLNTPTHVFISYQETEDGELWKHKTYHFYNKGKAYLVDFGALQAEFDDYEPEFEKALNSFNITR